MKRIVAVPGDRIELRDDHLVINGETANYVLVDGSIPSTLALNETILGKTHALRIEPQLRAMWSFGPVTVPPGSYFMMGDNRDNSFDSRYFGFVSRDKILRPRGPWWRCRLTTAIITNHVSTGSRTA